MLHAPAGSAAAESGGQSLWGRSCPWEKIPVRPKERRRHLLLGAVSWLLCNWQAVMAVFVGLGLGQQLHGPVQQDGGTCPGQQPRCWGAVGGSWTLLCLQALLHGLWRCQ